MSLLFSSKFLFQQIIALQKLWKMLFISFISFISFILFHYLKSSFRSWDIQYLIFLSFPLFLPVGHCFGGWSKINLKVHDIINCLNKNSIPHFVWYPEKENRYGIETLSIKGVLDKEHFYRKILLKICSKR